MAVRRSLSITFGAAALVAIAGSASAQYGSMPSSVVYAQPGMPPIFIPPGTSGGGRGTERPYNPDESDGSEYEDYSSRRGAMESPIAFKTELGKKLQRQDYSRSPGSILAARVKLAAIARQERLGLPDPDADKAIPGMNNGMNMDGMGGDGGEGMGGMGGVDFGEVDGAITPEMMERIAAMQAAMMNGATSGAPGGPVVGPLPGASPDGAAPGAPGASKVPTPEQKKAKEAAARALAKKAERFRLLVVAGEWSSVGEFIKAEGGEDTKNIYAHMLGVLQSSDQAMVPDEVLAVSEVSPGDLDEKLIGKLGQLLKMTSQRGSQASAVAAQIKRGTLHFGGTDPGKRKNAATLLVAAGLTIEAQEYLPPLQQARASGDAELLKLYAIYFEALAKTKTGTAREEAIAEGWKVSREVFAVEKVPNDLRAQALGLALGFLVEAPKEEGDAWLKGIFASEPDLAWKAIESVSQKARMLRQRNAPADIRLKQLLIARRLGESLLASSSDKLSEWRTGLNMMTMLILEEAEMSRYRDQENRMQIISPEMLNQALPNAAWVAAIDPGLAAKLELMVAQTTAGAGDTATVIEMIRKVVATDPARAQKLADAIVTSWPTFVRKSQPGFGDAGGYNNYRRYSRSYGGYGGMYGGGYGGYGGGEGAIPLTRARQQRNLDQLQRVLAELRDMKLTQFNPGQLVEAFASSHSDAEVYQPQDIDSVLGAAYVGGSISPEVRSKLVDNMRQRLSTTWRNPQIQQQAGTKRNDKELAAEVMRGYETAIGMGAQWAKDQPNSWEALASLADLHFDASEFVYGQGADLATYAAVRNKAFDGYADAAGQYAVAIKAGTSKPSARIFMQWFNAALGASDLGQLTRQDNVDDGQLTKLGRALASLDTLIAPGQTDRHTGLFAQEAGRAVREINPELKARFVRFAAGLVGDHPEGRDLRAALAYYEDIIKEIQLTLSVDGGSSVASGQPFGTQLSVWCTRAVSRESAGFAKYLMTESYNPMTGQPVNYRDMLEKKLRDTLSEKFEVLSVTFHKPTVTPMGIARRGWEQFPLAFIMLKAKDPGVDKLPSVSMDMDFSDSSGGVILPIASAPVQIDAKGTPAVAANISDVTVELLLDDRPPSAAAVAAAEQTKDSNQAPMSSLRLEVRAKGKGLLPKLDGLIDTASLTGATIDRVDDRGLNIVDLDTSGPSVVPVSERTWTLHLKPAAGSQVALTFPKSTIAGAKVANKRYADADIVDAPASIQVAGTTSTSNFIWWIVANAAVLGGVVIFLITRRKHVAPVSSPIVEMPATLTPFSAVATLRRIESFNGRVLSPAHHQELVTVIKGLEERYFAPGAPTGPDDALRQTVQSWVDRATPQSASV